MFDLYRLAHGAARWRRRLSFAVLLGLQGAIAFAPLLEPDERGGARAHIEQQGSRHQYQHDEATCVVCAVRSMHSSPAQSCPSIAGGTLLPVAASEVPLATGRGLDRAALARAPPRVA
jgi:hypothetical protein